MEAQPETLDVDRRRPVPSIGIPREGDGEYRISLIPSTVKTLCAQGHRIVIEENAGYRAGFSNQDYSEAGAIISQSKENVFRCEVIIKSAPPTLEEIALFHPQQLLIAPLYLPKIDQDYLEAIRNKKVIAIAMEYFTDSDGTFPIVRIMSEIAGMASIVIASQLLSNIHNGMGVLLGSVSGVPPSKVVVLGAGIVAEYAIRTSLGMGAEVRVFDNNISKLMRLQDIMGRKLYTSAIDPVILEAELSQADILIGAIHSRSGRAPMIVTQEMVMNMKKGAVIVDVSIDQGGCVETSRMTTHDQPTFEEYGVIHYGVPNIASLFSRTSSQAISHVLLPILQKANAAGSLESLLYINKGMRNGVYCYRGCVTNKYLAEKFDLPFTDIDLLLTSYR